MVSFPSIIDLLVPNFTGTTLLGIIVLVTGILGVYYSSFLDYILNGYGKKLSGLVVLVGLFLIFGISAIQDFITSSGGKLIVGGLIVTAIAGIILFYEPKKKGKRK